MTAEAQFTLCLVYYTTVGYLHTEATTKRIAVKHDNYQEASGCN